MKRSFSIASPETDSVVKRQRAFDTKNLLFDDAKQEREAIDIYKYGTDGTGYLAGKIFMIWPVVGNKLKIIFESRSFNQSLPQKFDVEFMGACVDHFEKLCFKTQDEVLLALKGARVELSGSHISTLKMKLQYVEGVLIKLVKRRGDLQPINMIINTWIHELPPVVDSLDVPESVDWFSTPHPQQTRPVVAPQDSSKKVSISAAEETSLNLNNIPALPLLIPQVDTKSDQRPSATDIKDPFIDQGNFVQPNLPDPLVTQVSHTNVTQARVLTKRQQRLERKRKKSEIHGSSNPNPNPVTRDRPESAHPQTNPRSDTIPPVASSFTKPGSSINKITNISTSPLEGDPTSKKEVPQESFNVLKSGFVTSRGDRYSTINTSKLHSITHMIGIVVSITEPSKTSTGMLCRSVKIIDPSQVAAGNLSINGGFKINFFTQKYPQWLPCPTLNDVIILRNIKITDWNGLTGVGYADKFRWAVYSVKNGKMTHGDLGDVPRFEGLAGGSLGQLYSPFFEPTEEEIRYCVKLFDWWQETTKQMQGSSNVAEEVQISLRARAQREHRLISEVDPSVPPQGYFNCTVEVWYVHVNDNGVCSLYVTDYTANPSTIPCSQQWCPPRLSECILKVEAWDNAADITRGMLRGEFYRINNLRAVTSTGGHLEGKLVETKIEKLDESAATHNGPFSALLERKKAWEETNPPTANAFEFSLIKDVPVNQHFTCMVEVVHVVPGTGYIYVTDYTPRPELLSAVPREPWTVGLHGLVVKILLLEGQEEMTNLVVKGEYYLINNLRLKSSTVASQFLGYLGGDQDLIKKVNVNKANEEFDALIARKTEWQNSGDQERGTVPTSGSSSVLTKTMTSHPAVKPGYTRINEVLLDKEPINKFRIEARIIDFYPPVAYDWVITHCTRCQEDLPKNRIACTKCNDSEYEFRRYLYQVFFLLQDECGDQLRVSVNDNCSLFKGLDRVDVRTNRKGYEALCSRLEPVFGKVEKALEERANNVLTLSDTPMVTLIIKSWKIEEEQKRGFCVASVEG